ncbi:MAG: imidazole glycerol phosphate synthase subunit HisF [Chitinophagaceae bacterium]|nr:imidazole glycerol phosphate synthase subunit HisF [Chitinophagaceae bacterium]
MLKHRLIPCLLLRNGGLVKTLKFSDPKYVGDPINAIRIFNDKEVDELMVLDITASKEKKEPNYALIEQFASECFMPLSYGGGIRTMEQAQRLFNSGIEKICLQTSVLNDLSLVKNLSEKWGSSSILVSIDVKRNWLGHPKLYSAATGKILDKKWTDFMLEAVKAGAGEIVLNAVDKDGTMKGMDTELISEAAKILSVPLVAVGGAGSLTDIKAAVDAGANAVSAGAFFVFQGPHRAVLITYPKYQELIQLLK